METKVLKSTDKVFEKKYAELKNIPKALFQDIQK